MILEALICSIAIRVCAGSADIDINAVFDDSRKVQEGGLFICIQGMETDGHKYIVEAVQKGARGIVVSDEYYASHKCELQNLIDRKITILSSKNTREAEAGLAAAFYHYPSRELKVIGITGTKGKTTTSFMIRDILRKAGYEVGLLGTIDYEIDGIRMASDRTTPEAIDIQRYLRQMAAAGCEYAVMEVSSQGLKMHRVDGIEFDVAVYTNLGHDHIGSAEHADMNEYAMCKSMLFKQCRIGIGNRDDAWYEKIFANAACQCITFGCETCEEVDYKADDITLVNKKGILETLFKVNGEEYDVAVPGIFSVYNALAAVAVCSQYYIASEVMREALAGICVPGRAEIVRIDAPYMVMIDYAHNAMSLKNILVTMRRYHPYRLIVLFGCGGNRSKARRREMGSTAGKYADYTIITSDNPRYEEPVEIMQEIEIGMKETGGEYTMIEDRRKAIDYALRMAEAGDIIILAGKGHEMYQEIQGEKYLFDEREIVREKWLNISY